MRVRGLIHSFATTPFCNLETGTIGFENITLASGREVPSVGLGIWKIENQVTAEVVQNAIDCGYRHFDSACDYGNEVEAGEGFAKAIADGKVTREDLWITSKLWNTYHLSLIHI